MALGATLTCPPDHSLSPDQGHPILSRRREIFSWALYDFGSSAFNTLILTFIFSLFFAQVIAPDEASVTATENAIMAAVLASSEAATLDHPGGVFVGWQ